MRLVEIFKDKDNVFLVTEICKGHDIVTDLEKLEKYPSLQASIIVRQILLAIHYCHKRGICHRDIKLDNIIIDENL